MTFLVTKTCVLFVIIISLISPQLVRSRDGDAQALLALKSSIDVHNTLPWPLVSKNPCDWEGVRDCFKGRVRKLVLENLNLTGYLDPKILNQLDQIRVLSFKSNSLSGPIPDLSALVNLKSIFLNNNNFSGGFPASIAGLHRVKVIVLSGNRLSGNIPTSLLNVQHLYMLYLQDNSFTGHMPSLNQNSLRYLNVSNNQLSGMIPTSPALIRFNESSFSGNQGLCGIQINKACEISPSISPSYPLMPRREPRRSLSYHGKKVVKIVGATIGGFVVLVIFLVVIYMMCKNHREEKGSISRKKRGDEGGGTNIKTGTGEESGRGGDVRKEGGFSWEDEGLGKLVFCGAGDSYRLEDLLKASAETLGRGSMGSTYKAVMESGFIVTVKRLKDARYPGLQEFTAHMEMLGRLRHPNLVPLRAYFQAKEERLLVYDYFPNGSLYSLVHGT